MVLQVVHYTRVSAVCCQGVWGRWGGAMAEIHPHSITSSGPCPRQHRVHLEENDALAVALGGHLVRPYRSARTPSSVAEVGPGEEGGKLGEAEQRVCVSLGVGFRASPRATQGNLLPHT